MGYSKSVTCAVKGCPYTFDVVVSRFAEDTEEARCPTCFNTTRMHFSGGSLEHVEVA